MRVKIIGFKKFKVAGKKDPSKVWEGINLSVVAPVDPKYGEGHQALEYTVWADQIATVLPEGPKAFLGKEVDLFAHKGAVEAIYVPQK